MNREATAASARGEKKEGAKRDENGQERVSPEAASRLWDTRPIELKRAAADPLSAPRASVLGLQRTLGNRATARLMKNAQRRSPEPLAVESADVVQAKAEGASGPVDAAATPAGSTGSTGLPDTLKAGLEGLSGLSLSDVKVHYNSDAPSRLRAKAFTKGTDIHVAPGQEQHVAHEGWHVVQQKQGRVRPTLQLKGESLNDDSALEREADEMGDRARDFTGSHAGPLGQGRAFEGVIQGKVNTSSFKAFVQEQVELQEIKKDEREEVTGKKDVVIESDVEEQDNVLINEPSGDEDESALQNPSLDSAYNESFPKVDKRYTTVGYEHEFGEMKEGPLTGVTHLELAESELKMPYTGIPFFIETDASNALELVSPPFLLETMPDSPIPNADDVEAVDELFKTTLVSIAQNAGTMEGMLNLFEDDAGLRFAMPRTIHVERKNITQNTKMNIYNNKWGPYGSDKTNLPRRDVLKIPVGTTKKSGSFNEDYHVQTHVNFASDAETYDDLQEQYTGATDAYRETFMGIEAELRDLLLGSAFAEEAATLKDGMDQVRQAIASAGETISDMTAKLALATVQARRKLYAAPAWTRECLWRDTTTNGFEKNARAASSAFAAVNKGLANAHLSPFQRDSLLSEFSAGIAAADALFTGVKKHVGDAFPEKLMEGLETAKSQAGLAATALAEMALTTENKGNLRAFLNTLARHLSGQVAVEAIAAVKAAQETRYGSPYNYSKFKPELMADQYLSSRVKDVKEVWIKDTVMNVGLGVLGPDDWKVVKRVMGDEAIYKAVGEMDLGELTYGNDDNNNPLIHELPTVTFRRGVLAALAQVGTYIDDEKLTENAVDPKKFIGPDAQPDFMTHDPKWIGARQDTYIIAKRVQMPEMWGSKRLHVVELRTGAAKRLRAMKKYREKQGRGVPKVVNEKIPMPQSGLDSIAEVDENAEVDDIPEDIDLLAPRNSGVFPVNKDKDEQWQANLQSRIDKLGDEVDLEEIAL